MIPEEEFDRLHDQSLWSVAPLVARGAAPRKQRHPVVRQWGLPIAAGLAFAVVLLASGTALTSLIGPVPAAPTTTAPAVWTPTPVFGGEDCGALFTPEQAGALLGLDRADAVPVYAAGTQYELQPQSQIIQQQDGITCSWQDPSATGDGSTSPWLQLMVLPAAASPASQSVQGCQADTSPSAVAIGHCTFTIESNGYLMSGSLKRDGSYSSTFASLSAGLSAAASAEGPAPEPWARTGMDWPASVDCAALGKSAGFENTLAAGTWKVVMSDVRSGLYPAVRALALGNGETMCSYENLTDTDAPKFVMTDILSGGLWMREKVATLPGAREVSIPGADSAFVVPGSEPGTPPQSVLYVFSGSNCVEVYDNGVTDNAMTLAPAVKDIVTALNEM